MFCRDAMFRVSRRKGGPGLNRFQDLRDCDFIIGNFFNIWEICSIC